VYAYPSFSSCHTPFAFSHAAIASLDSPFATSKAPVYVVNGDGDDDGGGEGDGEGTSDGTYKDYLDGVEYGFVRGLAMFVMLDF
jgi:hypothetical protein